MSSQGVSTENPNRNDTVVIASLDANNGVSNANVVIDLECTTLSAKDAEGDTLEQATDLDANNGISNANTVIGSECPTLSAKDAWVTYWSRLQISKRPVCPQRQL